MTNNRESQILTYLFRTEEESSMLMSSSIIKCHMGGFGVVKGVLWGEGSRGRMGLLGTRKLILSMGPVLMEVFILAQRATTPSKRFYLYHICVEYCCLCCINAFVLLIYFCSAG